MTGSRISTVPVSATTNGSCGSRSYSTPASIGPSATPATTHPNPRVGGGAGEHHHRRGARAPHPPPPQRGGGGKSPPHPPAGREAPTPGGEGRQHQPAPPEKERGGGKNPGGAK